MFITDGPSGPPTGFVELAPELYRDDENWIPEDPAAVRGAFSGANPWFETGFAQLLCIPGRARIAGFFEPGNCIEGSQAAYFGYWESCGDPAADAKVFAELEAWAKQQGAENLYGPINFTTYGDYRLLVTAGVQPFPGEPYNPLRYADILANLGFQPHVRYNSRYLSESLWQPYLEACEPALSTARSNGYRFEPVTVERWLSLLPELHPLADAAFEQNFAYRPLPYDLFVAVCGEAFVRKACPHTSVLAFGPDGDTAGVLLCYPHYGPIVIQGAGKSRVHPTDLDFDRHIPLLRAKGPVDMLLKTLAITRRHRGSGLMRALFAFALDAGGRLDYLGRWVAATAREDNLSQRAFDGQSEETHEYVLYTKELL